MLDIGYYIGNTYENFKLIGIRHHNHKTTFVLKCNRCGNISDIVVYNDSVKILRCRQCKYMSVFVPYDRYTDKNKIGDFRIVNQLTYRKAIYRCKLKGLGKGELIEEIKEMVG